MELTGPLPVRQVWSLAESGKALIVDVRGPAEFALEHPKGALSLPFSQKGLEERLGVLIQSGTPVILLAEAIDQAAQAVAQLHGGSFAVVGVAEGGMKAWHDSGLPTDGLAEVSVHNLTEVSPGVDMVVLDVREPMEWEMGHVPGALLISLGNLRERIYELPQDTVVAVICEAGSRSSSAASILQAEGFSGVANVIGGTGGYRNAGLPLQFPEEKPD